MAIQQITEGITGEQAATIIYDNDMENAGNIAGKVDENVLFDGVNTYDPADDVPGFYVDFSTGDLHIEPDSAVSKKYPVPAGGIPLNLFNRIGSEGFVFYNAADVHLKPVGQTLFKSAALNGSVEQPAGAVSYQFTTKYLGETNRDNIIVSTDPTGAIFIKDALIRTPAYIAEMQSEIDANTAALGVLNSPAIVARVNGGESTNTPEAFPTTAELINRFGIEILNDTTSPTKDIVGKKRRFYNTLTPDLASCFQMWNIPLGTARPSTISFAVWVNKAQFIDIFWEKIDSYLGVNNFRIMDAQSILTAPQVVIGAATTEYSAATMTYSKIAEVGPYIRLSIVWSGIVWKPAFVGTTIPHYWLFNGGHFANKDFEFIDPTYLFNAVPVGTVIYPDPNGAFGSNVVTLPGIQQQIKAIEQQIGDTTTGPLKVIRSGDVMYASSEWNTTQNLVRSMDVFRVGSFTNNPTANFKNDYLTLKTADQTILTADIKPVNDDITPFHVRQSYIKGNHSWVNPVLITLNGHGVTLTAVGTQYKDANNNIFTMARIVDVNKFVLIPDNRSATGIDYPFPTTSITPIAGGTSLTGYTAAPVGNLYTVIQSTLRRILINGKTDVLTDGTYNCDFVDVIDYINVLSLDSIKEKLIANRPAGGYTVQPMFNELGADVAFTSKTIYRFLSNGTTLVFEGDVFKEDIIVEFAGFIQAMAMATGNIVCPKLEPMTDGTTTFDFRKITPWTTGPLVPLHATPEFWENPLSPPDRILNFNNTAIFHMGYVLDRGTHVNRKDKVIDAMFLNTSKKLYPMGYSIAGTLPAGTFFSSVCFRQYLNPANNPAGRTNYSWFPLGDDIYIHLDYHGAIDDVLLIQDSWAGKKIVVVESNAKVTIQADVVTGNIPVLSTADANNPGYAYIKLVD